MADNQAPRFGSHRDGDVVLRDGSTVRIRVMRPADEAGLCELLSSLSEESRWLRFYCNQNRAAIAAEAEQRAAGLNGVRAGHLPASSASPDVGVEGAGIASMRLWA